MQKRVLDSKSAEETLQFGVRIAQEMKEGGSLFLFGDLGSGKTTFTQGFAQGLGIKNRIQSPTFIVMREYVIPERNDGLFYHVDLYRLETEREIEHAGVLSMIRDPKNVVVVEWAEKMKGLLPTVRRELHFRFVDEKTRRIEEVIYD